MQNLKFTNCAHILSHSVLISTLGQVDRSSVLLVVYVIIIAITVIPGKETCLQIPSHPKRAAVPRVAVAARAAPRGPVPKPAARSPPRPPASVFKRGAPWLSTRALKGNRTRRPPEGGKGHRSFLCGISKGEAPRRPETKARGGVNGEPRI